MALTARDILLRSWRGPRLPADGGWTRIPTWGHDLYAVLAVTGHAAVSAPDAITNDTLTRWGVDGWGGAHDPRVMTRLAGDGGWIDVLDAVLVAPGTGDGPLVPRSDLARQRAQSAGRAGGGV